jgi:hypothetical protein
MHFSRTVAVLAILLCAGLSIGAARATPMTISLDGLVFADGGTASGSFSFDPSILNCCSAGTNINFITTSGANYAGATYDSSNANPAYAYWNVRSQTSGAHTYSIIEVAAKYFGGPGSDYLLLEYMDFVPGGANVLLTQGQGIYGGSYEQNNNGQTRYVATAPTGTAAPAPEPASMLLLGTGIAGMGVLSRRKARAN